MGRDTTVEDDRELDWWPINHEHYDDAVRLLARLNLSDEDLHSLVHWASIPLDVDAGRSPGAEHGVRRIDYDKLYRALEQRANL